MRASSWIDGFGAVLVLTLGACSSQAPLPEPRSIIIYSGERIQADPERMAAVDSWLLPELERIELDPDFLIRLVEQTVPTYPWDTLVITADTASVGLDIAAPDAQSPYQIYAYLRLMQDWGTLSENLPETEGQSAYGVERAIVDQVADVWLLGRSVYDTQPFGPLDELVYSKEAGYLEDFIFATQGDRFPDAAADFRQSNPGREAEFRGWFQDTFEADGPQFIRPDEVPPDSLAAPDSLVAPGGNPDGGLGLRDPVPGH